MFGALTPSPAELSFTHTFPPLWRGEFRWGKPPYSSSPPEHYPIDGEGNAGRGFGHKPLRCKHWQEVGKA
jgi:hypothetical protein